jgi:hypothetical protein
MPVATRMLRIFQSSRTGGTNPADAMRLLRGAVPVHGKGWQIFAAGRLGGFRGDAES